jgi:hypothetical protein
MCQAARCQDIGVLNRWLQHSDVRTSATGGVVAAIVACHRGLKVFECCSLLAMFLLQVTPTNVDIASVAPKYHLYNAAEVEAVIARL